MRKMKIYLASGWFTPATKEILDSMESLLESLSFVDLYSPRRDGIVLPENQKHDTKLRTDIFNENVDHIKTADLVVANIYSGDTYNDTGTMYEIGYAVAHKVPVIGFTPSTDNVEERFKGLLSSMTVKTSYEDLKKFLEYQSELTKDRGPKILFVGNGDTATEDKLATSILDKGISLRWVDQNNSELINHINQMFDGADCLLAVIDDRKTLVSWMIGQAYARGIPVITYSDHDYGINIMLLVSVLTHIRGMEEFDEFLHTLKKSGLDGIEPFDISQINAM